MGTLSGGVLAKSIMTSTYDLWRTECREDTLDDGIDAAECSVCDKPLDEYALEVLNEDPEMEPICTVCQKEETT